MERQFEQGLKLQAVTSTEQAVQPADLEAVILEAIDLCFFSRQNISLCSRWNRSEFSESQDIKTGSYIFDIMRFEKQQIQQPDPVFTLNEWLKTSYPEAKIIGYDEMQEVWKASNEAPAIYGRLESITPGNYGDTWEVTWMNAGIRLHLISGSKSKAFLIRNISEKLLMMNDGGPMFISKVNYNDTMNPLKNRQFFIECQYGVLREKEEKDPIRKINIQEE